MKVLIAPAPEMTHLAVDHVTVRHAHAAHLAVAQQHFIDARVREHFAACGTDAGQDRFADAPRAAHGVEAAVHVMPRDQRLHHERRSLRRQPQVAPLAGQHRDQFRVGGQLRENFPGRALESAGQATPEDRPCQRGSPRRQRSIQRERAHAARDLAQQFEVAIDCSGLARKVREQVVAKFGAARDRIVGPVTDEEAIVVRVHGRPRDLALRQEIHEPARHRGATHVADVMHADVPLVTVALVAVRGAAGRVVLLEHRDAPAEFGQQRSRRQAADAGADDQRVIRAIEPRGPITVADAERAGLEALLLRRRRHRPLSTRTPSVAQGSCVGGDDTTSLPVVDARPLPARGPR